MVKAQYVAHRPLAEFLDAAINKYLDKPKEEVKIIDCGAGTGLCGVELHKLGYTQLCALDISPEMLNEARKKNVYQKFICAPLNSYQNPEVNTGEYDAMICIGALCAAHVKATALVEMIRMIKIGEIQNLLFSFSIIHSLQLVGELDSRARDHRAISLNFSSFLNLLFFISFPLFESELPLLSNPNTVTLLCHYCVLFPTKNRFGKTQCHPKLCV